MDYRRYYSQHGHSEWTIDALDRLKVITSENFINAIELNKKLYFACKNADQLDPLILKIKVEELIKNGATNDYLDANGSTALDMALLNESYDLIELIFAAVPSELYREDAEGMSVLAICFCRPIERWLGILKRRHLEYDDYIYQLFKSSGWFSKLCHFPMI